MTDIQNADDETAPDQRKKIPGLIQALYFDAAGNGPDEVCLVVTNLDMRHPEIPNNLGVQIHADPESPGTVLIPTGGGFMLDRESAADFHRQLGAWLDANPAPVAPAPVTP